MKKIVMGYEQYNFNTHKGWNLNGRIKNEIFRKPLVEVDSFYYQRLYQLIVDPQRFANGHLMGSIPFRRPASQYHINLSVSDIPKHFKYFYPIVIGNLSFYVNYIDEIEISDQVRQDVEQGRARIIFLYTNEGDLRNRYEQFNSLVKQLQLPKQQIIVFHGDHDNDYFQDAAFTYVPMSVFNYWIREYRNVDQKYFEYHPEKLFLTLNRTIRTHKQLMLSSLIKHDLLKDSIYSCGTLLDIDRVLMINKYKLTQQQKDILKSLELTSPDDQVDGNQILNIPEKINFNDYQRTFVSLVNETLNQGIFFSEKTFKPIAMRQPFIILAGPGHLAHLKKMGYKTFDKFWNEDYDQEIELVQRIEKISSILKYLQSLTTDQLVDMRQSMADILCHNQQVFSNSIKEVSDFTDEVDVRDYLLTLLDSE
jgi:hypothetical protein